MHRDFLSARELPSTAGLKKGGSAQVYMSAPDPDLVFNILLREVRSEVSEKV